MISYGGVHLSEPAADLVAWAEVNIRPRDLYEFSDMRWPGPLLKRLTFQAVHLPPVRLNTLRWPVGAARWACGHFFVSESQLDAIRALAVPGETAAYVPLDLVFSDGLTSITTSLWMLPAVPLATAVAGASLYLLTLVDDRYFWWSKPSVLDRYEGMDWANVYYLIGQQLGVSIAVDPIPDAYLFAPAQFGGTNEYLPVVLDAVARCCGQRIVRGLDGTVTAQNAATAESLVLAQLELGYRKHAGGRYALAVG